MKDLQPLKAIATQLLTLSAELLRLISDDERERAALIDAVKKNGRKSDLLPKVKRGYAKTNK